MKAMQICDDYGLIRPVVEQPHYSMFHRKHFEKDLDSLFNDTGYATTIWSPLEFGLLTGKYNSGEMPKGSRGEKVPRLFAGHLSEKNKETTLKKLNALGDVAKELGCS